MRQQLRIRKICSHPRAKQSKCSCSYYVFYGRDHRFSVDVQQGGHVETYSEAATLANGWRQLIDEGTFIRRGRGEPAPLGSPATTAGGLTLDAFAEIYVRDCSMPARAGTDLKDRQHPDYYVFQPLLAFVLPDGRRLGSLPFIAIDEGLYEQYIADRREQGYAASTVNKDVQLITAMCRWAERRGYCGPRGLNPISGESRIIVRKEMTRRQRRITAAELEALRLHLDPLLRAFIDLALITCLRLTELYRLRWSDYQRAEAQVKVRPEATKVASAERWAPLNERGVEILDALRVDPAGREYPGEDFILGQLGKPPVEINDRFNTALLKAFPGAGAIDWVKGVHGPAARQRLAEIDILFGDFRHEGALDKYAEGWQLNELQMLLGHSNLVQTSTYLGVGNEAVRQAMLRYGAGAKVQGVQQNVQGTHETAKPNYQRLPIRDQNPRLVKGEKQKVTH